MTQKEFWQILTDLSEKKSVKWHIGEKGYWIRANYKNECLCPINLVCYATTNKWFEDSMYDEAAKFMKLNFKFASKVADAADCPHETEYVKVAEKLLKTINKKKITRTVEQNKNKYD